MSPGPAPSLAELLVRHRGLLLRWAQHNATGLLAYESAEDVAQRITLRALERADRYEHASEREFVGWIVAVARQEVADRMTWWRARKRDAGRVLRLTMGGGSARGATRDGAGQAAAQRTGPSTRAERKDLLDLATRALAALPARDQELVRQVIHGVTVAESATRLGTTEAAAQRARLRAMDRLRQVVELARRAQSR